MSCNCILSSIGLVLSFFSLFLFILKLNLYRISNSHKVIIFEFAIFTVALLTWPFMIFRPKDYRNLLIPFAILRNCGEFLGFIVEVRGKENLKQNHGAVVIMNHQSTLDLLQLSYLWRLLGKSKIVVKKSLLFYPFFGAILWLSGFLFIDRKKHNKAINKLNQETATIQQDNYKLVIFPEGTRALTENFNPFRKGAFHIAIKSQCPIQPIVFSQYKFLHSPPKQYNANNRIIVSILPEIPTNVMYKDESKTVDLIEFSRNEMLKEYTKLSKELDDKNK